MSKRAFRCLDAGSVLAIMIMAGTIRLPAQVDTGAVLGTVKDPSGAVVPGAKVSLRNEGTSFTASTVTDQKGGYVFSPVKIGTYTVSAELRGFTKESRPRVNVNIQQQVVVDFTLQPGRVTQTVQVTTAAPLLQTQNASVGQVVGAREVNDLPLEGRNYTLLAQLVAGVTKTQQDVRGIQASGTSAANGVSYIGDDYLMNGIDNNSNQEDYLNGTAYVILPPIDAIQEFKVQTSDYSAQFGRSAGEVINVSTKSGTNQVHGDAWEFLRNSGLDAADFFEDKGGLHKGEFRQNQFGFALGGPIEIPHIYHGKDKTFFFIDYEGLRLRQAEPMTATVPTALEHDSGFTDFSDLITLQTGTLKDLLGRTTPRGTIFDPATTRPVIEGAVDPVTGLVATGTGYVRDPFVGNMIPASRLDPVGVKLANLYPLPTNSNLLDNYIFDPLRTDDYNETDERVDHNFSDKDTAFGTFDWRLEPLYLPTPFAGIADGYPTFEQGDRTTATLNAQLSETHSFSPTTINELRGGYSRISTYQDPTYGNELGIPAEYGFAGVPQFPGNGGLPQLHIGDENVIGTRGFLPDTEIDPTWQINDNLTRIIGPHALTVGGELMHVKFWTLSPNAPKGNFCYTGEFTSIPTSSDASTGIAQFLLEPTLATVPGGVNDVGGTNDASISNVAGYDDRETYLGFYGQDDWKATQKLTLNLGLRWDYYQPPYERWGDQANFVPGAPGSAEYLVPNGRCHVGESQAFLNLLQTSGIKYECSGNLSLTTSPFTDFAPRLGLAYQLTSKLVARAGYGWFYDGFENIGGSNNLGTNYPNLFTITSQAGDPDEPVTYPNGSIGSLENGDTGFDLNPLTLSGAGLSLEGFQQNYSTPLVMDWNFTRQYQLTPNQTFQVGYVGNASRHLYTPTDSNIPSEILPPGTNYKNYIEFPSFNESMSYVTTQANSYYNSLQATYERRFSDGLNVLADYTYSKCRTDARDFLIGTISGYRAPDLPNFGIQADYALCDWDVPNIFHLSGGYILPIGNGERFLRNAHGIENAVLGGWHTNFILTLQDGPPFGIGCAVSTVTDMGCNALTVPGVNIYSGLHNVNQWLNPAAFADPPPATAVGQSNYAPLGGAGTQALGPGFHRLDFSLFKEIRTSERTHLEFRTEVFNITNNPNFALPTSVTNFLADPKTFTESTATVDNPYDSREIQFALKFYW
jgi:hypothetical protein